VDLEVMGASKDSPVLAPRRRRGLGDNPSSLGRCQMCALVGGMALCVEGQPGTMRSGGIGRTKSSSVCGQSMTRGALRRCASLGECCYGMGGASRRDNCRQGAATRGRGASTRRRDCIGEVMMRLLSRRRRGAPLARMAPGRETRVSPVLRMSRSQPKGRHMKRQSRMSSRGNWKSKISEK
jgi:hypothetical protein